MDDAAPPVTISELVQLAHLGVPPEQVTWCRVTMTSDQWLCIRIDNRDFKKQDNGRKYKVSICDPFTSGLPPRVAFTNATSVLMNPSKPIIAFKDGGTIGVYNIDTHEALNKCSLSEDAVYWTWVNSEVIAIVTDSAVQHWNYKDGYSYPEKVFSRHDRLNYAEIFSYKADASMRWFALTGLIPRDKDIHGITQLYSVDKDLTQCFDAHAICFASYQFAENPNPSTILCVASRDADNAYGKVHILELGPYIEGNMALTCHYDTITFLEDPVQYDFPVTILVSPKFGLVYVVTKYGYLHLIDVETSVCLCSTRISSGIVFTSALNTATGGLLGVSRNGQVLSVEISNTKIVPYVKDVAQKPMLAERLQQVLLEKR